MSVYGVVVRAQYEFFFVFAFVFVFSSVNGIVIVSKRSLHKYCDLT